MKQLSDEEVVARYQQHPNTAANQVLLDELLQSHYRRVRAWCYRLSGDRESALDLTQEVFFRTFLNIHNFRGECKFSTWLYRITQSVCFKMRRIKGRSSLQANEALLEKRADFASDPYQILEKNSRMQFGQELLHASLTETEHRVMTLHFVEEMSLEAVSHLLQLKNRSGARAFLMSAKRKLVRASEKQKYRSAIR